MYIVMNKMQCLPEFADKFEELFKTRAHAIDHMEGFKNMWVLKSENNPMEYIVSTLWESEEHFKNWIHSPEFLEGHQRGFAFMANLPEKPLVSTIEKYKVIAQ